MIKKKVLHIQLLPLLSGVQNMMLLLLDNLDRDKYEIFVICRPDGPLVERLKKSGYHYLPVKSLRRNLSPLDLISLIHIYLICRKYRFDIVHTHSSKTGFLGRIASRIAGVPKVVHTVHGFPFHSHQLKIARSLYLLMEMFAGLFCDYIAVVNRYEADWAKKSGLFPKKKLLTIYNAIETKQGIMPLTYDDKGRCKPAKGLPILNDYFTIGSIARFSRQKNILTTIEVAINACRENPNIKFVFIGDGELWDECNDLVLSAGLAKQIILPGWQTNIDYWLTNIDLFLLYSNWEGLSISILEAMSAGLPIIASEIKGNNELVDQRNGILVPLEDPFKLRKILIGLPQRSEELERWSNGSLQKVKELFSVERFVQDYERLYESQ